jgi:hypothetical protein
MKMALRLVLTIQGSACREKKPKPTTRGDGKFTTSALDL